MLYWKLLQKCRRLTQQASIISHRCCRLAEWFWLSLHPHCSPGGGGCWGHLKASLRLDGPLLRWLPHVVVGRRPQFHTLRTSPHHVHVGDFMHSNRRKRKWELEVSVTFVASLPKSLASLPAFYVADQWLIGSVPDSRASKWGSISCK